MWSCNTDAHWEYWGRNEPYWGVLTAEEYRRANLNQDARKKFFASGDVQIEQILKAVRMHLVPGFVLTRGLDFGCGVGRLTIPLSRVCKEVVGVDISTSMLTEARKNCTENRIENVELIVGDDALSRVQGPFDLVISFIVMQHIRPKRGVHIFRELVKRVRPGGVGVLHLTYSRQISRQFRLICWLTVGIPGSMGFFNLLRRRPLHEPAMLMNEYDLNEIFDILKEGNCPTCYTDITQHGPDRGIMIYFRKDAVPARV